MVLSIIPDRVCPYLNVTKVIISTQTLCLTWYCSRQLHPSSKMFFLPVTICRQTCNSSTSPTGGVCPCTVRVDIRDEACLCVCRSVPRLAVSCPSCEAYGSSLSSIFPCVFCPVCSSTPRHRGFKALCTYRLSGVEVGCGWNDALFKCHSDCYCPAVLECPNAQPSLGHCFEEFTEA